MTATETTFSKCLPPEACIRILRAAGDGHPKFRSSVFPKKQSKDQKLKEPKK